MTTSNINKVRVAANVPVGPSKGSPTPSRPEPGGWNIMGLLAILIIAVLAIVFWPITLLIGGGVLGFKLLKSLFGPIS